MVEIVKSVLLHRVICTDKQSYNKHALQKLNWHTQVAVTNLGYHNPIDPWKDTNTKRFDGPSGAFISAYFQFIRGVWIHLLSAQTAVYDSAYFQPKQGHLVAYFSAQNGSFCLLIFCSNGCVLFADFLHKRVHFVADFFCTKGRILRRNIHNFCMKPRYTRFLREERYA